MGSDTITHGTLWAYSGRRCRCDACKTTWNTYWSDHRAANREKHRDWRKDSYQRNNERRRADAKASRSRRKQILARYKLLKGCSRCGYRSAHVALEFHHRDREEKLFNIAMVPTRNWQSIKDEVKKCDVVCANCHAELHYEEKKVT